MIFAKGYGLANVSAKTPVTPDTLFGIGSVTKQFTCAVALQLEQERKLSFDDRMAKYDAHAHARRTTSPCATSPAWCRATATTTRSISSTGRWPRRVQAPRSSGVRDAAARLRAAARAIRTATPATCCSDTSPRWPAASRSPRRWSGGSSAPLGLRHTRFEPARGGPGMAEGYTPLGLGPAEPAIPEGDGWIGAAGGIWSTPTDLLDLGSGADGRHGALAGVVCHDEHAAPAHRRTVERVRLRAVDPRSRTGARAAARRRR